MTLPEPESTPRVPAPANVNAEAVEPPPVPEAGPQPAALATTTLPAEAVGPVIEVVEAAPAELPARDAPAARPASRAQTGSVSSRSSGGYVSAFGGSPAPLGDINEAVLTFVRSESEAALAHMTALTQVRSAADLVRLQVGAFQRAADASLTCLSSILRSASGYGNAFRP